MIIKFRKIMLAIPLLIVLNACGSSSDSDDGGTASSCDSTGISINAPIANCRSYTTNTESIELSGNAYGLMSNVDCVSVFPPTVTISWHNASTGERGMGGHSAFCRPNPFATSGAAAQSAWVIYAGIINLRVGENIIEVTGSADGRSETSSITISRTM